MDFVDQINFVASATGRILNIIQQLTGIIDLGTRRGINFNQINKTTVVDFNTAITLATGSRADALFTIERFGKYSSQCGFTHSAGAGKQKSMM